jgi:hypothetical protein
MIVVIPLTLIIVVLGEILEILGIVVLVAISLYKNRRSDISHPF